ncbi:MAG: hypothetical protein IJS50_04790 [Desulfovibrio sp.]|nr:hypothetical protein [Desulfovibrio sp.]
MQRVTDSWIESQVGCRLIQGVMANAARNVPKEYLLTPWKCEGLDRGKAVLTTPTQLDCYVLAYWHMHIYKLWKAFEHLPPLTESLGFEIVDWGCGQAIATLCLLAWLEKYSPHAQSPSKVTLLDVSTDALRRAKPLVQCKLRGRASELEDVPIDLSLADCTTEALRPSSKVVLHLFSNIIDVPRMCLEAMAEAILRSSEKSYVICVGHGQTAAAAEKFRQLLGQRSLELLHKENVRSGAELENGHPFGWDITIMQRARQAKAA